MILLDDNKNPITVNPGNYISKGSFGQVYHYGKGNCIKLFTKYPLSDPEDTLVFFRDHDFSNFYNIKNIYYNPKDLRVIGYKMKFYKTCDIDLHTVDSSYILDSYNGLLKDIELLSRNGITLCDFAFYNLLLTEKGIISIDADLFNSKRGMSYEATYIRNLYELKLGLVDLISSQYRDSQSIDKQRINFASYCAYVHSLVRPMENDHDFSKTLSREKNLDSYMRRAL